ncbi:MAG: peptide deformylase, partial [Gammaproteobacteria bacterium]
MCELYQRVLVNYATRRARPVRAIPQANANSQTSTEIIRRLRGDAMPVQGFKKSSTTRDLGYHHPMSRVQFQGTNTRMNEKRTIIITGAASGIGLATAQALLGKGHRVTIVDVNEEAIERCQAQLLPNDNVHIIAASASDEEGAARVVAETTERFGRIEVLFNNAGIGVGSLREDAEVRSPTIEELTPDDYLRFFGVNVLAAVTMTRACIASLKSAPWGRIINNTTSYMTMHRVATV